jgi:hypothetical protein
MRHFLALFLISCALLSRPGLALEKTETLLNPSRGFPAQGGPAFKAAYFPAGAGTLVGGRGELALFDGSVGLGVGSYSLASELLADQNGVRREIGLSYGGLVLDYSFSNRKLFYLNFASLFGPAQAYSVSRLTGATRDYSTFFIAEPELSIMLNTTQSLRLGLGISYRITAGADNERTLGTGMDGYAATFTLMYGKI